MKFLITLERHDYRITTLRDRIVVSEDELNREIGKLTRGAETVMVNIDGMVFKGRYESAGGDWLPVAYHLSYERIETED